MATDSADVAPTDSPLDTYGMEYEGSQVKHYLAYFHHAFKMQPNYLRLYYGDGQVDEETRKKIKYSRKDVPEYERLFTLLQRRDAKRREQLMSVMMSINGDADEQGGEDNTLPATDNTLPATDNTLPATDNTQSETQNP